MLFLPEAQFATGNASSNVVEIIVAHGAPGSLMVDLQTTFTLRLTADESQAETCQPVGLSI